MQQIRRSQATCKLLGDILRFGIHHVADTTHGGRGKRAFVYRADNAEWLWQSIRPGVTLTRSSETSVNPLISDSGGVRLNFPLVTNNLSVQNDMYAFVRSLADHTSKSSHVIKRFEVAKD
jgi:hypothetical protein